MEFGSTDQDLGFPDGHEYLAMQELPPDEPRTEEELSALLVPVVVSTSVTTTHAKDLEKLLLQQPYCSYSLLTLYTFRSAVTNHGVPGHAASLVLKCRTNGAVLKELDAPDCFPSKKHAREAAAALGLDYVRTNPPELATLPCRPDASPLAADPVETENWIGIVQEGYCDRRHVPPHYTYYQRGEGVYQYSCDLTLPGIEGRVFGDPAKFYRTKKSAKTQAAKNAVAWLAENQQLLTLPSRRKMGRSIQASASPSSPAAASSAAASAISAPPSPPPAPSAASSGSLDTGTGVSSASVTRSVAMAARMHPVILPGGSVITLPPGLRAQDKVMLICPQVGLHQPEYTVEQEVRAPSIYDATAYLTRAVGRKVKIGPRAVVGKKHAKEQIAGSVLIWLVREAQSHGITIHEAEGSA